MRSTGIWLLILGGGSFILPMFGLQFRLLDLLGDARPIVAGAMAVVGVVLLALSFKSGTAKTAEK
jgi:hypothetical protein